MWLFGWKQPGALCCLPPVATWKNKLFACLIFYVDGHQSGLIVFLFRWSWKLSPCLVMRSRWVVQDKHTFLFTSISNSVDDLLFINQFYFWFDFKFSFSQIPAQLSFDWIGVWSFFFTSPDQTSPTSWYGLSWCHCVWPFQGTRLWFHVHVQFSKSESNWVWENDLSLQKS